LTVGNETFFLRSEGRLIAGPEARRIREAARLSLRDVAEAIGVSHIAVQRYEAGTRSPRGAVAERYASFLRALRVNTFPAASTADKLGEAAASSRDGAAAGAEALDGARTGLRPVPPSATSSTEQADEGID
jgi:transcriptional regulator with XRE-family HTH domain